MVLTGLLSAEARELTFDERVVAQEAIERVYYSYQIGTDTLFEHAVSKATLEQKVVKYLKQSAALETYWHTTTWTITDHLKAGRNEIEVRLAQHAPKQYWIKRLEIRAGRDMLFRDSPAQDGEDNRLYDQYTKAVEDFQKAERYAWDGNLKKARRYFQKCIDKARRVEIGAEAARLKEDAADLQKRARFELKALEDW